MNLVFVGCEYTGKSTLAAEVMKWAEETLGRHQPFPRPLQHPLDAPERNVFLHG